MMHHPPFSVGFHRMEWQADSVLYNRRETMVKALREAGSPCSPPATSTTTSVRS
jgi:hypothetical protein